MAPHDRQRPSDRRPSQLVRPPKSAASTAGSTRHSPFPPSTTVALRRARPTCRRQGASARGRPAGAARSRTSTSSLSLGASTRPCSRRSRSSASAAACSDVKAAPLDAPRPAPRMSGSRGTSATVPIDDHTVTGLGRLLWLWVFGAAAPAGTAVRGLWSQRQPGTSRLITQRIVHSHPLDGTGTPLSSGVSQLILLPASGGRAGVPSVHCLRGSPSDQAEEPREEPEG
jgi:hypothetical protein